MAMADGVIAHTAIMPASDYQDYEEIDAEAP